MNCKQSVNERNDVFKSWLVKGAKFEGQYDIPVIAACKEKPTQAIPFDKALCTTAVNQWVHFFIDDRRFECVWHNPKAYLNLFKRFAGVISTDFSLYREMPLSMQIWNTYRNRALSFWLQSNGLQVIPNIRWGDERTYAFCFDGVACNSTVAVSTNGCIRSNTDRQYFKLGLQAMVERLSPRIIINYSNTPDDIFAPYKNAGIEVLEIPNFHDTIRKRTPA